VGVAKLAAPGKPPIRTVVCGSLRHPEGGLGPGLLWLTGKQPQLGMLLDASAWVSIQSSNPCCVGEL